jgi:hypothetical protein
MPPQLPPAVYKCILPVNQSHPTSSAIYHSFFGGSKKISEELPFPAWPYIDDAKQPCCLPTLMRAVYFFNRPTEANPKKTARRAVKYLTQQENIDPAVREYALAFVKSHNNYWQHLPKLTNHPQILGGPGWIDVLSVTGEYVDQVLEVLMQALIYGNKDNFYNETDAFSLGHEFGHRMARQLYIGEAIENLVLETHRLLAALALVEEFSPELIGAGWEQVAKRNVHIDYIVRKYEPIEEIFATYYGLRFIPGNVRSKVEPLVKEELKKRHWEKVYEAFAEVCDAFETPFSIASHICQYVCVMLAYIDMDGAEFLRSFLQIYKVIWLSIDMVDERIEQANPSALDKLGPEYIFDLEEIVVREAAEEINRLLDEAHIPRDIYWYFSPRVRNNLKDRYRLVLEAKRNNDVENVHRQLFGCVPDITLVGSLSRQFVDFILRSCDHVETDIDNLPPLERMFYESLRQQLMKGFGWVCPFDSQGSPLDYCCGRKESITRLYQRLPEEYRNQLQLPICALV